MNHEFNNREKHEKILFSDECHAIQGNEVWLTWGSVPGVSGEGVF